LKLNLSRKLERAFLLIIDEFGTQEPTLKAFQASAGLDGCARDVSAPLVKTYYHNGQGNIPQLGDTIYIDEAGTQPLDTKLLGGQIRCYANGENNWHQTSREGVVITYPCE